ncbi:prohibitin family protein [Streptomyces sp. YIM 98790]|uniref:prohibitin family protein n=1 Tax=Streptomyces sp. YIM 98790 TaxID=2689077 RepID=UPI0028BE93FA|nr:prohibitin family protein [Streptomyces sp. YIM 98790]
MFFAVLLILAAVGLFVAARMTEKRSLRLGALGSLLAGVLAAILSCVHVVGAYEVGVPVTFGKVGDPLNSGMHLKLPFTSVTTFSTRPVDLNLQGEDEVEVRSSQGGVMYVELTVKWSVNPDSAVDLYRLAGDEKAIQERLVYPDSREIVRNVFAQHTSEEGYASAREQIGQEISAAIKDRLAPRGITVTNVNLRNVQPSEKLQEQIDRKIQQQQATERAEEEQRTAEAEAERKRIEAEGIAEANRILEESLTDRVLAKLCIDAFAEAAAENPVYTSPCGDGGGTPVIVDGTED